MASSQVTLRSDAAVSLLEPEKTLRASAALVAHLKSEAETKAASASKKDLLAAGDDDEGASSLGETPVFVTFTTKRHPTDSRNLKRAYYEPAASSLPRRTPSLTMGPATKIPTPFPIETDPEKRICLIVADVCVQTYTTLGRASRCLADLKKPQRHYKNLVADPEFPDDLRKNVSRIIDLGKLKKKYTACNSVSTAGA